MTIEREKSGSAITCPKCRQQVTVPEADEKPPLGLPVSPAPSANPAPPSGPASDFDFDPEEDEEGDYETYRRRKRRRASGGFIWRAITLAPLGVAMLCFFLPWVRYSIVIPFPRQLVGAREPIEAGFGNQSGLQVRRDRIEFEFASQSGLQVSLALASLQPALDRWTKMESEATEAKWRKSGRNPLDEWLKRSKPYMAPWLFLYPLALGFGMFITITSRPTVGSCSAVGASSMITGLLLLVQFGGFGPPAVGAFYDELAKNGNHEAALIASLVLDVQYTFWFWLAVLCIVAASVAQIVFGGLATRH